MGVGPRFILKGTALVRYMYIYIYVYVHVYIYIYLEARASYNIETIYNGKPQGAALMVELLMCLKVIYSLNICFL